MLPVGSMVLARQIPHFAPLYELRRPHTVSKALVCIQQVLWRWPASLTIP